MQEAALEPYICATGSALPPHAVAQTSVIAWLRRLWAEAPVDVARLEQFHRAAGVSRRHLALPLAAYAELRSFAARNAAWTEAARTLGETALRDALVGAGLSPGDVDHLFFVTVTGIGAPTLDVYLANRLDLRRAVKRTPIFGLGCVAGATGIARAADYLRAYPNHIAVVLSVEICSLTWQPADLSIANVIASGLFGDAAAAVVLAGAARSQSGVARVVGSTSVLYPHTEEAMGWEISDGGFKVVLSPQVPALIGAHIAQDVDTFLAHYGLGRSDIRHWIAHTGGPKVLQVMETALALRPEALTRSWRSLESVGNVSSASVLLVLADLLNAQTAAAGDYGLVLAMGPGFGVELVLLRW